MEVDLSKQPKPKIPCKDNLQEDGLWFQASGHKGGIDQDDWVLFFVAYQLSNTFSRQLAKEKKLTFRRRPGMPNSFRVIKLGGPDKGYSLLYLNSIWGNILVKQICIFSACSIIRPEASITQRPKLFLRVWQFEHVILIFVPVICFHWFSTEDFEDVIYPQGDPDAVSISKRDVELLLPETFVNDTIIDFYIK